MKSDFLGFRFGPYHSSDLHLIVTSNSNRYQKNLLPSPNDYSTAIPGGNGSYYYGQTFKEREIKVNVAFDNIDEMTFRRLAQIFSTDELQDLVFDEQPYKTYRAKCKSAPDFKFVCFKDPNTKERIYKGEGSLNFICYHPFAYCFNKYIVTAADYYKTEMPETILNPNSIYTNPYENINPKSLSTEIKEHYNIDHNMGIKWNGGYPSIEQVQWGELYYNEGNEKKLLSDARFYWDNIPQWQAGAKLLATPTLDYDRELIYMPQYSKTNYYNMETGMNKQNALIGTRVLVYNPGDIPVDFTIELKNIKNKLRLNTEPYRFRISRYNVQRLSVQQAVDWTGLTTYNPKDNLAYKYGKKYVNIREVEPIGEEGSESIEQVGIDIKEKIRDLKDSHPSYVYIAEPVPRERLAHYLKNYVYQTYKICYDIATPAPGSKKYLKEYYLNDLQKQLQEFQDTYSKCITEDEKNELYWKTLKQIMETTFRKMEADTGINVFGNEYNFEEYFYDFIHEPLEYILTDKYYNYDEVLFNAIDQANYITEDWLEISSNFEESDIDTIKLSDLKLDFEKRLLYNDEEDMSSQYHYAIKRNIYNDHIEQGKWFQIPPGWSLIEITPVINESIFDGKKWLDARSFKWGIMSEKEKKIYNRCEELAMEKYISENAPLCWLKNSCREDTTIRTKYQNYSKRPSIDELKNDLLNLKVDKNINKGDQDWVLEEFIQFRRWYENDPAYERYLANPNGITRGVWKTKILKTELNFLKLLNDYWRLAHLDKNGYPTSDAEDWWWESNNYLWVNYPPVYWSYVDILNGIKVNFTPEYY